MTGKPFKETMTGSGTGMTYTAQPDVYTSWYGKFYHSTRACSVLYRAKPENVSAWHPNMVKDTKQPCPECVR